MNLGGIDLLYLPIVDSLISLTRWLLTETGSRVFFSTMAPIQAQSGHGERGERLTNTPFSAKDGGRHRQERALVLTSLRCDVAP